MKPLKTNSFYLIIFNSNSWVDMDNSIRTGKFVRRKGGLKKNYQKGAIVSFRVTGPSEGDYKVAGIATRINPQVTVDLYNTNRNWPTLEKTPENIEGQFEFIPFPNPKSYYAKDFNIRFRGTHKSCGRNQAISITEEQYYSLLNEVHQIKK
jgi:hypothetical protein